MVYVCDTLVPHPCRGQGVFTSVLVLLAITALVEDRLDDELRNIFKFPSDSTPSHLSTYLYVLTLPYHQSPMMKS
jgi:hypothetical protein